MIQMNGPVFQQVDNRLLSLQLVKRGYTDAVLFGPDGQNLQASEALYKKNILAIRGSFRPVTKVNIDMIMNGYNMFIKEQRVDRQNLQVLFEITLNNLRSDTGDVDEKDFIDRADILCSLGPDRADQQLPGVLQAGGVLQPVHQGAHGPDHGREQPGGRVRREVLPPPERRHAGGLRHPLHPRPEDLRVPEPCLGNCGDHDHRTTCPYTRACSRCTTTCCSTSDWWTSTTYDPNVLHIFSKQCWT